MTPPHVRLLSLCLLASSAIAAPKVDLDRYREAPSEIAPIVAPFAMPQLTRPAIPQTEFNILNFGAVKQSEDPEKLNTDAIHQAIAAAHSSGGGRVIVPEGTFLTGAIHLMSNIELHLEKGATLSFSDDFEQYLPVVIQRHEGVEAYNYSPFIYAFELENVAITGSGQLDGNGDKWWEWYRQYGPPSRALASKEPLSRRHWGKGAGREGMRPNFVVFWKCKNVLVEGIKLVDSPMWNVHLVYTENAIVRGIMVDSLRAPNGDGVVVDSSKNVLVEYNHFETGDDAVVIKSGLNEDGLAINIPTENLVVRNFSAGPVKTGSGGVVFGSETSGGIRNVYVHDAIFDGSDRGIRFKTERGRGNVTENIYIRDIVMRNLTREAITFNTYYSGPGVVGPSPTMRNIQIRDIDVTGVPTALTFVGLPELWLQDIHLENIIVRDAERAARIRRVKNLTMTNVQLESKERAMILSDIYEAEFEGLKLQDEAPGAPLLIEGGYLGALVIGDFPRAEVELGEGVSDSALQPPQKQAW